MKRIFTLMLFAFFTFAFCGCEKAEITDDSEESSESTENDEETDDFGSDSEYWESDNGGWADDDGNTDNSGIETGDTVNVETFKTCAIYKQVWVKGYIVGAATGKNGKTKYEFGPEYTFDTAILMSDNPDADNVDEAISVCLTTCSERIRAKLNLCDHPENKGRQLAVFGYQETYLGVMGVKKIDAYRFWE